MRQIKRLSHLLSQQPVDLGLLLLGRESGQIHRAQRHRHVGRNDLHGLLPDQQEGRTQTFMALNQRLQALREGRQIQTLLHAQQNWQVISRVIHLQLVD